MTMQLYIPIAGTWARSRHDHDASVRCGHWLRLYSERGWKSRFRWLGNRFGSRTLEVAHVNRKVTGGHSGILSHPAHIGQWDEILSEQVFRATMEAPS